MGSSNGPAVILGKKRHQAYTTQLNKVADAMKAMEHAKVPLDRIRAHALSELKRIYARYPDWIDAVVPLLK